nr:5942_t:CDS:10 [Entrophospora candida]
MSNIYIQEPHTNGKVILHTTSGDISIELFSKETPKTCRNFIQLSLEGYYDKTIFHRIVPGFIVQCGDPTGTGHGPFVDELHTRLRFVRRGLVAMANAGKNDNRSQFFITLDRTDELQNKHTIFGKVVDDTIFNVLKIGELEVDENERPLYPPQIISTEVVWNPFDDIIPRISVLQENLVQQPQVEAKKKKLKKNVALLSFGEETNDFESGNNPNLKIKSIHDLVENDPRLSKEPAVTDFDLKRIESDKKMRQNVKRIHESMKSDNSLEKSPQLSKKDAVRQEIEQVKDDIRKIDQQKKLENAKESKKKDKKRSYIELQREQYLVSGKAHATKKKKENQDLTLEKLKAFQDKLDSVLPSEENLKKKVEEVNLCLLHSVPDCLSCRDTFGEHKEEETDEGWLSHLLVFEKDLKGKDLMQRRDDPDDYVVIDPRVRKKQAVEDVKAKRSQSNNISDVFHKDNHKRSSRDHDKDRNQDADRYNKARKFDDKEQDYSKSRYKESDRDRDRDRDRGYERDRDRDSQMEFWKPGTIAPGASIDRETEKETNENIFAFIGNPLLYLVEKFETTIIVGQTGCGKTTQLPQYLYEAGWAAGDRTIACSQPRRVAAISVADRVATEMNVKLGEEVGYSVRFDECCDPHKTRIKYLTDGMLFREAFGDPLLSRYSVIMVDEAHERSLYTDLLLGLLKKIQKKRPELKLIISSATIDAKVFYDFFNTNKSNDPTKDNVSIISLEGKIFPIDIQYLSEPCSDYVEKTIQTIFDIHVKEPPGDILVFLTGQNEINRVAEEILERATTLPRSAMEIITLPIYAGLPYEQQLEIFKTTPYNTRKVVVATNIAEASITIEGIVYIIDCGFVKLRAYNPKTGMESLTVSPISKASARQRAGRAGRLKPGKAYRLYTEDSFYQFRDDSVPEIQRSNLAQFILHLKALGIDNVLRFDFISPPPSDLMIRALELLYSLKALDDYGRLTMPLGMQLAEIPVDAMLGKILLDSYKYQCGEEILTIAAMLSVQNVFIMPSKPSKEFEDERRKFAVEEGDHITLLNGKKSRRWCYDHSLNFRALSRALSIRHQLRKYMERFDVPVESCGTGNKDNIVKIRKCLVSGYFANAAKMLPDGSFQTIRNNAILHAHPSSVLFNRNASWVIFHEVVETTKPYMRDMTVIDPAWLSELAPHFYKFKK